MISPWREGRDTTAPGPRAGGPLPWWCRRSGRAGAGAPARTAVGAPWPVHRRDTRPARPPAPRAGRPRDPGRARRRAVGVIATRLASTPRVAGGGPSGSPPKGAASPAPAGSAVGIGDGDRTGRVVGIGVGDTTGRGVEAVRLRHDVPAGHRTGRIDELVHERVELVQRHLARGVYELFLVGARERHQVERLAQDRRRLEIQPTLEQCTRHPRAGARQVGADPDECREVLLLHAVNSRVHPRQPRLS